MVAKSLDTCLEMIRMIQMIHMIHIYFILFKSAITTVIVYRSSCMGEQTPWHHTTSFNYSIDVARFIAYGKSNAGVT